MPIPTTQVQFRRGTATETSNLIGGTGEITVDLTNHRIVVHDAITAGGYTGAKLSDIDSSVSSVSGALNTKIQSTGQSNYIFSLNN